MEGFKAGRLRLLFLVACVVVAALALGGSGAISGYVMIAGGRQGISQ